MAAKLSLNYIVVAFLYIFSDQNYGLYHFIEIKYPKGRANFTRFNKDLEMRRKELIIPL
jgi:hypothetical protein